MIARWFRFGLVLASGASGVSGASGCAYKVTLTSQPELTEIVLPGKGGTVITPVDVTLRYVPFGKLPIVASAPGYRPLELDLRKSEVRLGRYITDTLWRPATLFGRSRGVVRLVLIPEHGPVGTWVEDEVP